MVFRSSVSQSSPASTKRSSLRSTGYGADIKFCEERAYDPVLLHGPAFTYTKVCLDRRWVKDSEQAQQCPLVLDQTAHARQSKASKGGTFETLRIALRVPGFSELFRCHACHQRIGNVVGLHT